jgi:hypothetical protein
VILEQLFLLLAAALVIAYQLLCRFHERVEAEERLLSLSLPYEQILAEVGLSKGEITILAIFSLMSLGFILGRASSKYFKDSFSGLWR